MARTSMFVAAAMTAAALTIAGCKTQSPATASDAPAGSAAPATGSDGGSTGGTTAGTTSGGSSIPALVSVNLQNVLNDLSVSLQVNRNNIPVTAQVPIAVAASVCGVSVDVIAASAANGHATCTATTMSPQLTQAVQQQIASGGSVTGGPQTMGTPTNNQM